MKNTQTASKFNVDAVIAGDRRQEIREQSDQQVTITVLSAREISFGGYLIDISRCGMGLLTTQELNRGATLGVEWGETIIIAEVVRCCKEVTRYHVGLRISYIILDRTGSKTLPSELFH
jgi:hypothetical protein